MAVCVFAGRNEDEASIGNFSYRRLNDTEIWWIYLIVSEINGEELCPDIL